jgi:hypothetical protein
VSAKLADGMAEPEAASTAMAPAQEHSSDPLVQTKPPSMENELTFEARQKITLRCGKSSITLHPNGKIVLKGEYILSDAEGINRIAGGHIELN